MTKEGLKEERERERGRESDRMDGEKRGMDLTSSS